VDDDESVRHRLDCLIRSRGCETSVFDSSQAFLREYHRRKIDCLVVDAHLSGVSGLQLQRMLDEAKILIPMVLVTAPGDVVRTRSLAPGVVRILAKPFSDEDLVRAITALISSAGLSV
jgi:FixJ family two-component response regulator